jgi:hypothetical protein
MSVTASHLKKVYAKASSAAPSSGDEIKGVTEVSDPWNRDKVETTAYSDDIYKLSTPTLIDISLTLSGFEDLTDTPQGLLRSYLTTGATLYFTVLHDGTNGYTYPAIVTGYERSGAVGEVNKFTCNLALAAAPVSRP